MTNLALLMLSLTVGAVSAWPEQLAGWLRTRGLLAMEKRSMVR